MTRPVVLDLRYATAHFPGVGSYAVSLVRELLRLRPRWPWRVLVPERSDRFDLGFVPRTIATAAPAPSPGLGQARLGARLRAMDAALYHAPYLLRPWGARCPCVVTVHDVIPLESGDGMRGIRRIVYRELVRDALRAELVLTDSDASRTAIAREFPHARDTVVVHPGCREAATGEPWAPWPRPALLVVGINKPHKNLETLVRALALVPASQRPLLVSAGPVDGRHPDLPALAARHGVAADVVALGLVPESRLAGLYASAALFAFPTRREGFGLPLLEALAYGVPAIASDLPVLREVGGDAARWCPADDAEAWARAIRELLSDDAARARLAHMGPERARAFDPVRSAERVLAEHVRLVPELAREEVPCA